MADKTLKEGDSSSDYGSPILATAEQLAISRINDGNYTNKVVYIVRVKDSMNDKKERVFAALKMQEAPTYLQIIGIELLLNKKTKQTQTIDKYSQIIEKAQEEIVVDLRFPWHRVNEIRNVSYQYKMQKGK